MKVILLKYYFALLIILYLILFFIPVLSCAKTGSHEASKTIQSKSLNLPLMTEIANRKQQGITIAYRLDSAPMQFKNERGHADGILIDIWRLWSIKSGIPIDFIGAYNKEAQNMVLDGRADINAGLFSSELRLKSFDFSEPMLNSAYHVFYQPSIKSVKSISDFNSLRIGVTKGSFHENYLKEKFPELKLSLFDGYQNLFNAARNHKVDGFVTQSYYLQYHLSNEHYDPAYKRLEPALYKRNYKAGVKKGNQSLLAVINHFLPLIGVEDRRVVFQTWLGRMAELSNYNDRLALTDEELEWLKEHPVIDIGIDGNWPPYDFMDENGEHAGVTHDFMNIIASQLRIKFNPVPGPDFGKMLNKVKQGKLIIGIPVTRTSERSKDLWFSNSFVNVQKVIIARKDVSNIHRPEDLFGKVIAVEKGYSSIELLKKHYPEIKIIEVHDTLEAIKVVSWGKVDAYIGNGAVVQWLIQQHQISNLEFKGDAGLSATPQRFAIYKDEQFKILVSIINKALTHISTNQRNNIYQRWLGGGGFSPEQSRNIELTEQEYEWLDKHEDIRMGVDHSWPPVEFIDRKGVYRGLTAEYIKLMSNALKLTILPPEDISWSEVIKKTKNKQLDILSAVVQTKERSKYLNFTKKYLSFPFVIFVNKERSLTTDLADLHGKKVALESADPSQEFLARDHPEIIQVNVSDTKEALEKLSLGQVDAYVGNLTVGSYLISKYGFNNLKIGGTTDYSYDLRIGVRKDWPELVSILNKFIDTLTDEEKSRIKQKWLSIQYDIEIDDSLVREVIIVASILLLISLLWIIYIRRKNALLVRSEEQLNKIIDAMPVAVAIMDTNSKILRINTRVANEFSSSRESVIDHRLEDFFDLPEEKKLYMNRLKKRDVIHDLQVNLRKGDGGVVTGLLSIIPILIGSKQIRLGVFVNLTERIKMEEALKKAKEESEQANEFKSHFLANMSHEIRTPMNAIIGMAHLAMQTKLNNRQYDYINKLKNSAHHLLGIINDILDFSKIEAGMMSLERIDFRIDDVLDNVADIVNLRAREKGLEILFKRDLSIPDELSGDPLRLGQVLINLVQNAIKFTEQGEIIISSQMIKQNRHSVKIAFSVSDSGIGIKEDMQQYLFEAFIQADSSISREHGGTGLGLSISKQIVELMGGQLSVSSEVGKGSVFSFIVDINKSRTAHSKLSQIEPKLQGMRVLLVDDNPVALKISQEMLTSLAFEVTSVSSAKEAFSALEENAGITVANPTPFDLLFIDWRMPEMTGIEAIHNIQSHMSLCKSPKFILITAYSREEVLKQAENVSLDGFLIKPFNPSTLFDCIMSALNTSVRARKRELDSAPVQRLQGKILLVEDNTINQQVAKEILEGFGLLVVVADNGQIALDYLRKNKFDLVLMDIQMPVMDGFEATKQIRLEEQFSKLPVIAMTAHAMTGDKEKCISAGMNDYLSKPIVPEALRKMMSSWLKEELIHNRENLKSLKFSDIVIPENIEGIDIIWGLQRVGGNQTLFLKLLKDFNKSYDDCYLQLSQLFASDDIESARRMVHTIHGVAGNIGASKLQASARDIEEAIRKGNIKRSYLAPLIEDFGVQAKTVFHDLDDIILCWEEQLNSRREYPVETKIRESSVENNIASLIAQIEKLIELLLAGDAEAISIMDTLKNYLDSSQLSMHLSLLNSIEQQISDYDYDAAAESLQQFKKELLD